MRQPVEDMSQVMTTNRIVWCGALVVALALYAATANPGPQWQDSGWQQLRVVTGQLEHPRGLALTHPLQYFLGRAALWLPIDEPAFAITLVSALAAAVAVANLALTIQLLTRRPAAACIAATALMLSHTFWQHATHTESYALTAALLTGEWLALAAFATGGRARYLLLVALLNGAGIANHLLAGLALPVDVGVFAWAIARGKCSRRTAGLAALLWLVGTLPYSGLVVARMMETGAVWDTLHSALFGAYAGRVLNVHVDLRQLLLSIGYVAYNFPGLLAPVAILGAWIAVTRAWGGRWMARALLVELVAYALFVVRYSIGDQYTFFFPVYLLVALFGGLGLDGILRAESWRAGRLVVGLTGLTAVWTPAVYLGTCSVMRAYGLTPGLVKNKPYRDGYRAFFVPWGRGEDYAVRLNGAVRKLADEDGLVVFTDTMMGMGVRYAQAIGRIPGAVEVVAMRSGASSEQVAEWRSRLREALERGRPVVLIPYDRDRPETCVPEARWQRCGDIYRLAGLE
jgi:hypothetical protein